MLSRIVKSMPPPITAVQLRTNLFLSKIRDTGLTLIHDDYEKRKLEVFNKLNILGMASGLFVPLLGVLGLEYFPLMTFFVSFLPALISFTVLKLNEQGRFELARMVYFLSYPVATTLMYISGLDLGIELFFILYGLLALFYFQKTENAIFSFALSAGCYSLVFIFKSKYGADLHRVFFPFYVCNHLLATIFIFYSLFWIRRENAGYQLNILKKNRQLHRTNLAIEVQKSELDQKAALLQEQTDQLTELNSLKNKLFSVIAHDLKGPIYAQRNLLKTLVQHDVPGEDIKQILPDILTDMNYTINLMDNLLQWAKCQMQADTLHPKPMDLSELIRNVTKVLRLQAESKKVYLENKVGNSLSVLADKDMINLVLRNLLSNAIKFTPEKGSIVVEAVETNGTVEIRITDTGRGMRPEELEKLSENTYYTTKGTANESGTGLGLMLCREFLHKSGSAMRIESSFGKGSTFSFSLPRATELLG
jgi:two-component system sensor histidine kinase/response regulator